PPLAARSDRARSPRAVRRPAELRGLPHRVARSRRQGLARRARPRSPRRRDVPRHVLPPEPRPRARNDRRRPPAVGCELRPLAAENATDASAILIAVSLATILDEADAFFMGRSKLHEAAAR